VFLFVRDRASRCFASLDRIVCDWTQCDRRRAARTRAIRHDGNADRERDQHDNRKSVHEAPG
jgi:hypothetical protein